MGELFIEEYQSRGGTPDNIEPALAAALGRILEMPIRSNHRMDLQDGAKGEAIRHGLEPERSEDIQYQVAVNRVESSRK